MTAHTLRPSAQRVDDIELLEADRHPLTVQQLRQLMGWTYGADGQLLADLWHGFNQTLWDGKLDPAPMWMPTCTDWGRWIGLYRGNHANQTLSIQVKWQLSEQDRADVLLHEMVHQALHEAMVCTKHNAVPWCQEIMRLTQEIWGVSIWASPSLPRKVKGKSARVQKPSPTGAESITRKQIAGWPWRLGLHVPIQHYLGRIIDVEPEHHALSQRQMLLEAAHG
jgi:hypothetical protein